MSQLHTLLLDVEEVAVGVEVVQPVRVDGSQLLEVGHRLVHLPHVVKRYCHLGRKIGVLVPGQKTRNNNLRHNVGAIDKPSPAQTNINFNCLLVLLEFQVCVRQEHLEQERNDKKVRNICRFSPACTSGLAAEDLPAYLWR